MLEIHGSMASELRKHFNSLQTFIGYQIYFTKKEQTIQSTKFIEPNIRP